MSSKISDKDVLQLFASLKNAENTYPQDMITSRRDTFSKQVAAMAILAKAGVDAAVSSQVAATKAPTSAAGASSVSISTILETALVIAIVVEAGVAAYAYREKIAEFFNSTFGPKVEQIVSPPDNSSSDIIAGDANTAETSEGTPAVTETPTPPGFFNPDSIDNDGDAQVASTQAPIDDDNGLHLGQTKQPSKEPKKNDNNDSKDNKK